MPISKLPELQGALFPSADAMQLAERKVMAQRAEAAKQEEERRRKEEVMLLRTTPPPFFLQLAVWLRLSCFLFPPGQAESAAKRDKESRLEAKRVEAEQRLQQQVIPTIPPPRTLIARSHALPLVACAGCEHERMDGRGGICFSGAGGAACCGSGGRGRASAHAASPA